MSGSFWRRRRRWPKRPKGRASRAKATKAWAAQVDEALERALRSLERFIDRVPGYEAPEIMPNGDIVIRKKPPRPAPEDAPPAGQRLI